MKISLRTVTDFAGNDVQARIQKIVQAKVDLGVGLLIGLDTEGKAILANASTGVPAVGVVYKSSPKEWGEGITEFTNPEAKLRAGDWIQVAPCSIVKNVDEVNGAKIGQPVYLGENGLVTLTKNAESGQLNQKVGVYATDDDNTIRVILTDIGEVNA